MDKTIITTPNARAGLAGYSQGVTAGGTVSVSGTGPIDAASGVIVGSTIQEQTALLAAESGPSDVVWPSWSLRNPEHFDGSDAGGRWFTSAPPARHGAMLRQSDRLSGVLVSTGVIAVAR